jgi:hypothetical protein
MHLGVDYGTAWSKLVLRDMEARAGEPEAFVLRPENKRDEYRFPSIVTYYNDRIYFGWKAEELRDKPGATALASLKMRMVDDILGGFHGIPGPLPAGLSEEDLAVLTVFYLLQEGLSAAREYTRLRKAHPKLSITLGVPMTPVCYPVIQEVFSRVAARAFWMLKEGRWRRMQILGIHIHDAMAALAWSREAAKGVLKPEQWVRSEAGAALHWAMWSPKIADGLYAAVDMGAGTMSTSVFNIVASYDNAARQWVKSSIAVFGASCGAPAMDAIDEILAKQLDSGNGLLLRGKEAVHSATIDADESFVEILKQINENRRSAFKQAYQNHKSTTHWATNSFKGLFLFGGGHRVQCLQRRSRKYVWTFSPIDYPTCRLDWPADLRMGMSDWSYGISDVESFASDLLVGYGLSFPGAGVFPVENPESIEPVPVKDLYSNPSWRDSDDLYAK